MLEKKIKKKIWQNIKKETQYLLHNEPILKEFFYNMVLKHENFDDSLSYILSYKLSKLSIISLVTFYNIFKKIYKKKPSIINSAILDIQAIYNRDPLINKYSTPFLHFKGFHALQIHRINNWLWNNNRRELSIYLQNIMSSFFSIDIHPAAQIGYGIMLDHATGIVIGSTTIIENNVSILQSVTLGGTYKKSDYQKNKNRHPLIKEGVFIGAGAKILGNIEIGKNSKIAAGSVILKTVPPNTTAVGVPARIIEKSIVNNSFSENNKHQISILISGFEYGDGI
ncbi:serine O-acetyltransferase [Candidatus Tachikawaea gelatinosa]|uniref:Serine acetyltransferase n=1 Tax=Candidatus Tachikawaea gelatinosa TaxID=1410383 RepID=A0A090BWJ7_9ENTR|nr:serine O-acetyltransferase [Candidatus Tachikawaea gelatinosa]BAP58726.1 serine acetyltransferase [Candidatus Tachikawaea gelatinosa]